MKQIVVVCRRGSSNLGLWMLLLAVLRGPDRDRVTPYFFAWRAAFRAGSRRRHTFLANVPSRRIPLAAGIRACSAAQMLEVPKAWDSVDWSVRILLNPKKSRRSNYLPYQMTPQAC